MDYAALSAGAIALARQAGEAILAVYHSDDFGVETKTDDSPLTRADRASHEIIVAGLQQLAPAYPVLSEEAAALPYPQRAAWETYWLVDPLDGTKEFIKRNGEFTVNIALIQAGCPVLGVVYVPVSGRLYYAAETLGAFRQDSPASPAQPIRVRPYSAGKARIAGSRSHAGQTQVDFLACLGETELRSIGSSLKICLVAEGEADLYPRFGPTSEWDTAAAQCVVEQAGGQLTDLSLAPLRYNGKESLLNPYFIVFGERHARWESCLTALRV